MNTQNIDQNKKYCDINNIKKDNNELKNVGIKNLPCYYFDGLIKIENFAIF